MCRATRATTSSRGWECVAGGVFSKAGRQGRVPPQRRARQQPFLTLPTSCAANPGSEPLSSSVEADSWADAGDFCRMRICVDERRGEPLGFEGCSELPFTPAIDVSRRNRRRCSDAVGEHADGVDGWM